VSTTLRASPADNEPAGSKQQLSGLPERRAGGRVFRIGNKVTQIRNNYDKGHSRPGPG
jgi:hypothetical protein